MQCFSGIRLFIAFCGLLFFNHSFVGAQEKSQIQLKKADSLFAVNNYSAAHQAYLRALKEADIEHSDKNKLLSTRGIGVCYYYLYDKANCLNWFYRYLEEVKSTQTDSLLHDAYYLIGVIYIENGVVDSVNKYSNLALDLMQKAQKISRLSQIYGTLAEFHIQTTKKKDQIENYLSLSEKYARQANDSGMLAFSKMKQFNYHFYFTKDYHQALIPITEAVAIYERIGNTEATTNAYRAKAECLAMNGDKEAAVYMNKWFNYKDSVFDIQKASELAHFETLYETEKKEAKIKYQQGILYKEQKNRRLTYILSVSVVLLLLLFVALLIIQNRRKTELIIQKQNEKLINEVFQAEQKERIRIARDLHDSVGQKLSVAKMLLPSSEGNEQIKKLAGYLDDTAKEVRAITHNLSPEILNFGWLKAMEELIDTVNSTEKLNASLHVSDSAKTLELELQTALALYRIVQELLNNIVAHAQSNGIEMKIDLDQMQLHMSICDNGIGLTREAIVDSKGLGWRNIFTRVKLLNGQLKIDTIPDKGNFFNLNIPVV